MLLNENLLNKNKLYIVGVSGGCDSMALLDVLRIKGYRVLVAHVNYNYRDDTDIDYEVVSEYCAKYGIAFYYKEFHHDNHQRKDHYHNNHSNKYILEKDLAF